MTTNDIDAIRQREQAATEGPWPAPELDESEFAWVVVNGKAGSAECAIAFVNTICDRNAKADAEFIAHARTDVPALCDEVERLRAAAELDGPWKAFLVHEGYVENLSELNDDDEVTVTVVRDSAMPDDEGRMPGTYTSSDVAFEITDLYVDGEGDPAMAAVAVLARARAMAAGLNTAELAEAATR